MKNLWISIKITLAMCVVLFVGYVLVLRLVAWVASPNDGEAPVVTYNGKVVGAANVGPVSYTHLVRSHDVRFREKGV